jgi:hypothetical protein
MVFPQNAREPPADPHYAMSSRRPRSELTRHNTFNESASRDDQIGFCHPKNPRVNIHIDDPLGFLDKFPHVDVGSPTNIALRLPDSLDGFTLDGGAEAKLGGPWSLKLEYRWTHLDGGSANASDNKSECIPFGRRFGIGRESDATASADLDTDLQTVRGVLTYHFGGAAGG